MKLVNILLYIFIFIIIFILFANIFPLDPFDKNFIFEYLNFNFFKIECVIAAAFIITYLLNIITNKWLDQALVRYKERQERRSPPENKKKKGNPNNACVEENTSILTLGKAKLLLQKQNDENNKFSIKVSIISGAAAILLGKLIEKIFYFIIIFSLLK